MTPNPTRRPIRKGLTLIVMLEENQHLWLRQWAEDRRASNFVGGNREQGQPHREYMVRESSDKLGLSQTNDFRIPAEAATIVQYTTPSRPTDTWTRYHREVAACVAGCLLQDPDNHWIDQQELQAGMTANNVSVSPTIELVNDEADLWSSQRVSE